MQVEIASPKTGREDRRDGGVVEIEAIDDIHAAREQEAEPEERLPKERRQPALIRAGGQLEGKLDDRIAQPLALGPLLAQQDVHALHRQSSVTMKPDQISTGAAHASRCSRV